MKTTFIEVMWKKEKNNWKRIKEMRRKFTSKAQKWTIGTIIAILLIIIDHVFMLTHTIWETLLFIFCRSRFKINLNRLALTV
jgi:hypothetical protein